MNKDLKALNKKPVSGVKHQWNDDGRPSPRLPTSDYIQTVANDYTGTGKTKRWNPQKERYMEFVCARGMTAYEESDLNMSPEGKMRRQLMS